MYQPPHHREDRLSVQHDLIRAHPLGLLISYGAGGLLANPLPFVLDAPTPEAPLGRLRGHYARANRQWRDLADAPEVLVVFQGPQAYVSPSWYATKRETGRVVPTWNYIQVQVRGRPQLVTDGDWLARVVADLTVRHEADRPEPWAVEDAPADYRAALLRGIVGIEIPVSAIDGKWKISQNRPPADRNGVARGLAAGGVDPDGQLVGGADPSSMESPGDTVRA